MLLFQIIPKLISSFFLQSYSFIARKANKKTRKLPLRSIKISQEAYLIIRVYKTGQTLPFAVWQVLAGLCLCIGKMRHILCRNSCLPTLSSAASDSWDVCRIPATCQLQYYRIRRQVIAHLCHILWSIQSISKGRHEAGSPLAIPAYWKSNAHPAITDAHNQRTDYQKVLIIRII